MPVLAAHGAVQPAPPQLQPAQPPGRGGTVAAAARWPSNPPASKSPTAPAPVTDTMTVSAGPAAPEASPPPTVHSVPAASTGGAATRFAVTNAASERNVAGVRTPAKRLRGSSWRQPSTPTVSSATPAITRIAASRVDARTKATIALAAAVSADAWRPSGGWVSDVVAQPRQRQRVAVVDPAVASVEQLEAHSLIG